MLSKGSRGLMERCREQFAYGHVDVLRRYVGVSPDMFLAGLLPHDEWGDAEGGAVGVFRGPTGKQLPIWTWTEGWRNWHIAQGASRAYAIGAPWLYLLRMRGLPTVWEKAPGETRIGGRQVYLPLHSWERETIDLKTRAAMLAQVLDPDATLVLLGWGDFLSRDTRRSYERAGFSVDCSGYRGGELAPASPLGDRGIFLDNLLDILLTADRVISEEVATGLVYASSLGVQVHVMAELRELSRTGNDWVVSDFRHQNDYRDRLDALTGQYAWMADPMADVRDHAEEIKQALGGSSVMSPEDLGRCLEWRRMAAR
jgi:hypothetical protein